MPHPTFADYECCAVMVRALADAPARKAALLILSSEIRRTVWCDDCIDSAAQLATALVTEAVRIDADALDAVRVLMACCEARP